MYDAIIKLGSVIYTQNAYGQEVEEKVWKEVFAEVRSVSRQEFYSAAMAGIRPTIVFALADYYDYDNEKIIWYDGKTYDVIRTYSSGEDTEIEITAEMRERDGNRGEEEESNG